MKAKSKYSWNQYFMEVADVSSKRSKDPITKVGAVIMQPTIKRIVSIGYNGLPRGMEDSEEIWFSDDKHNFVVHAEANAILNSMESLDGDVLYTTMFPCNECAKLIVQKGIKKVIYRDNKFLYKPSGQAALKIFKAAGVELEEYKDE